jgi:peptidyl-prolyl cis-trans isomerase C
VKSKFVSCALAVLVAVSACKKSPASAAQAANTATPPAAAGQGSGAPPAAATPPAPPKPVPTTLPAVVARVNGQDVKKEDFERMIKSIEMQAGQQIPPDRRDEILRNALDQLIVYTMLSQESKTRGIKVEDSEIEGKIQEIRSRFQTPAAFDKALKERGETIEGLRQEARLDLSVTKLMEAELSSVPGPSDAEAKDFYAKNPDQFKAPETVRASHILIRVEPNADAATKAQAKAKIESVLKKAKAGEDFAKLAQQYSQDGSAAQGGDLGPFPREQMVPEFSNAAFALKPGQISDVVTTQFGYHIIKVTEHQQPRTIGFEEAAPRLKQFLETKKKDEKQTALIEGLKKKSKVEVLI